MFSPRKRHTKGSKDSCQYFSEKTMKLVRLDKACQTYQSLTRYKCKKSRSYLLIRIIRPWLKWSRFLYQVFFKDQKQPSIGVLRKRCSENMQQVYRRTPMPKCDFKVENHTSAWVFSYKFLAYFQNTFS